MRLPFFSPRLPPDRLVCLLFHGLFADEAEIAEGVVLPQQRMTIKQFGECLDRLAKEGWHFVSPRDLATLREGRNILLTFDDGYYNNHLALPLLEKHQAPAVFFIATEYVRSGESFWWDALYRSGEDVRAHKRDAPQIMRQYLIDRHGSDVLTPKGDSDRPFTPAELCTFAKHPLVHIGNHTIHHAILSRISDEEAEAEIVGAQATLREWGTSPIPVISYPIGAYNPRTPDIAEKAGFTWGITVEERPNALPLSTPMLLGRHTIWGDRDLERQIKKL